MSAAALPKMPTRQGLPRPTEFRGNIAQARSCCPAGGRDQAGALGVTSGCRIVAGECERLAASGRRVERHPQPLRREQVAGPGPAVCRYQSSTRRVAACIARLGPARIRPDRPRRPASTRTRRPRGHQEFYADSETSLRIGGPFGAAQHRDPPQPTVVSREVNTLRWPRPLVPPGDEASATATVVIRSLYSCRLRRALGTL